MIWIALVAAGLVSCVVAELAARRWIRARNRYHVFLPGLRLELHLDRTILPELEPVIRFEINSVGERGAEVRDGQGLYRVLVAGGSAVEGFLLDQATCWPGQLEHILGQAAQLRRLGATRVHVGSIGRSGVASRDLDHIFARILPRYPRLDAIVIMIGASDVLNWLACGAPADAPAPPAPVAEVFALHPDGPFGWHPRRWALVDLANRWRRRRFRPLEVRHGVGKTVAHARAMRAGATEILTASADPRRMLDNFERCFAQLLRRARLHTPRVLVVRQPWFEKPYTPEERAHFWDGARGYPWKDQTVSAYYAIEVVNALMAQLDARAARIAEALDVEQIEVRSLLEPSLRMYYDHWHCTPAGARAVAEAVAAALLQRAAPAPCCRHPTASAASTFLARSASLS